MFKRYILVLNRCFNPILRPFVIINSIIQETNKYLSLIVLRYKAKRSFASFKVAIAEKSPAFL